MLSSADLEYFRAAAALLLNNLQHIMLGDWFHLKNDPAHLESHELDKDHVYISLIVGEPERLDLELWLWRNSDNPEARLWFGIASSDREFVTDIRDNLSIPFRNWVRGRHPPDSQYAVFETHGKIEQYFGLYEDSDSGRREPIEEFAGRCSEFFRTVCLWLSSRQGANKEIERVKRNQAVSTRPGQQRFSLRARLRYNGTCAVTGCTTDEVLDAAHIRVDDEHLIDINDDSNGILLRTDIHALFDALLITLTSDGMRLEVSRGLTDHEYQFLCAVRVCQPISGPAPSSLNIEHHRRRFQKENPGLLIKDI